GTLIPQDKESFGSVTSHEENAIFIFEESRTLLSNQLAQGEFLKLTQKHQSFRKEPKVKTAGKLLFHSNGLAFGRLLNTILKAMKHC
ncbi:hypothetical protein ACTWQL_19240, partial [Pseudalkalibacillus sp. R45]|uniref:hypothetical protein n=1 Tax=Pseudalkalibacillus sp. R45 TaxID=3457433 RepID=UPI003FCE2DCB